MTVLIIIRGAAGSGKSTYAKKEYPAHALFEADDFFTDAHGVYEFNPKYITEAHSLCQSRTREYLEAGKDVVVANTFTKLWEMKAYQEMAEELGIAITYIHMETQYGSAHGVPEEVINRMIDSFEDLDLWLD